MILHQFGKKFGSSAWENVLGSSFFTVLPIYRFTEHRPNCRATQIQPKIVLKLILALSSCRGSVMRYKCDRGFRIFGQAVYHCQGTGWSANRPPICAGEHNKQSRNLAPPHRCGHNFITWEAVTYMVQLLHHVRVRGTAVL